MRKLLFIILSLVFLNMHSNAQGTWVPVTNHSPDYFDGVSLLLSDGTIMVKACNGGIDTIGNLWDKLTPDTNGSYVNGTWSRIDTMHYKRLYCSSQVLKDGRVYVAGGEYHSNLIKGEVYNPLTGTWTITGSLPLGYQVLDGNTQLLPDGQVLQNIVLPNSRYNCIFDPTTNTYNVAATSTGGSDEAAWLKLPDNSILFVDIDSKQSERYIPSLSAWVLDDTLPVSLYDIYGYECGAAFMLPDGRAFFIGSTCTSAYYTPSGTDSPGTWAAGPPIPDNLGAPDAAAAMMPNGKILCALSKTPGPPNEYFYPVYFYEYDYLTNTFTNIAAPIGGDTMHMPSYMTGMLDLPDGNIFLGTLDSSQFYIYVPGGSPVSSGVPVVDSVIMISCDTFMATGLLFNGISQGASYGDDWQMPTNYPLIRLVYHDNTYGDLVYYTRTFNWNSTGIMTGNLPDTTYFTLPAGLPYNNYDLVLVANGIPSAPYSFTPCNTSGITKINRGNDHFISVYPNPASGHATIMFEADKSGMQSLQLIDVLGRTVKNETINAIAGQNSYPLQLSQLTSGIYTIIIGDENSVNKTKLVVE